MKKITFLLIGSMLSASFASAQQPPRFGEVPPSPGFVRPGDRDGNGIPDHREARPVHGDLNNNGVPDRREGPGAIGGIRPGYGTPGDRNNNGIPDHREASPHIRPGRPVHPHPGHPGFLRPRFQWRYAPGYFAGHRIIEHNGKRYIDTPDYCGITQVSALVTGDNVIINNLEIVYGDGGLPQNLVFGAQVVHENTYTPTMDLDGYARCINGFMIDAWSDHDLDRAQITLYGYDMYGQWIQLGTLNVREYNLWRGFVRPGYPVRPVYPTPLMPVPTLSWSPSEFGPATARKILGLNDSIHMNLDSVTEISLRAAGNSIRITSLTVVDQFGNRFPIPAWSGVDIPDGISISRRISDLPMYVQRIELTGVSNLLGGSKVEIFSRAGLAR